ncbi:MAG: flippase-like domain-containing protein [Chloroflexi bacterium]|nr:flippase-like domain-containing protein [Chloroflexota bacterium]
MLKKLRFWLGLGLTSFFLFLLFYRTDFSEIGAALRQAQYWLLAPAVAVYFLTMVMRSWRWAWLLRPLGRFSFSELFAVLILGYTINNLLPLRLGELGRAYLVGRGHGTSKMAALGTIALERVWDGLTLLLFILVVSFILPLDGWLQDSARLMGLLLGLLFVAFLALASSPRLEEVILGLTRRLLPGSLGERVAGYARSFMVGLEDLRRPRDLAVVLFLSVLVWLGEALVFAVVAQAFSLQVSFSVLLLTMAVANLVTVLPSSQGGIGPFEWAGKTVLVLFGAAGPTAAAYVIVLHATFMVPLTLLGLLYLAWRHIDLGELTAPSPEAALGLEETHPEDLDCP